MGVVGTARAHLNPVREALRADDGALHGRLLKIRAAAGCRRRFRRCGSST
ncbi:hypothetical protein ACFTWF_23690 [Rhodococcus sp. NPDC056960]